MSDQQRTDAEEREHAQRVRLMSRFSWLVLGAGTTLALGPLHEPRLLRGVVLALMFGIVLGLNVPAYGVVRRAQREGAPPRIVRVLVGALGIRIIAAVIAALALSLEG